MGQENDGKIEPASPVWAQRMNHLAMILEKISNA